MTTWQLENFGEALDRWIDTQQPSADLRLIVTEWVLSRFDDPYRGVHRVAGFDNLWYGQVPRTLHGAHLVVTCSYWITETEKVVRCDNLATLSLPL